MKNCTQKTKHALVASVVSLILCCAMLLGTTFAWFTDSVTNTGNTIQAGMLDVGFQYRGLNETGDYQDVPDSSAQTGTLFTDTKWEPGKSNGVDLKVINLGNLALEWNLYFSNIQPAGTNTSADITEVLDVYVIGADEDAGALTSENKVGTLADLVNGRVTGGILKAGDNAKELSVVVKMQEQAGNEYKNSGVTFNVELRATQAAEEFDGFGNNQYDALADGTPEHPDWNATIGGTTTVTPETDGDTLLKVEGATVTVPSDATTEGDLTLSIVPTTDGSVTVGSDQDSASYDVTVTGLSEDNTVPVTVELYVGKNQTNVQLYHKGDLMKNAEYDASTGYVTFTTTSFSPYTVVWDVADANVTNSAELAAAIENAQDGAVIALAAGNYTENVTVNKDIVLSGNRDAVFSGKISAVAKADGTRPDFTVGGITFDDSASLDEGGMASLTIRNCEIRVGEDQFINSTAEQNGGRSIKYTLVGNTFVSVVGNDVNTYPIFTWGSWADGSVISDNVFGSTTNTVCSFAFRTMNVDDGATITVSNNVVYSLGNYAFSFYNNADRPADYTIVFENNVTTVAYPPASNGGFLWIESRVNREDIKATVVLKGQNTYNGKEVTKSSMDCKNMSIDVVNG